MAIGLDSRRGDCCDNDVISTNGRPVFYNFELCCMIVLNLTKTTKTTKNVPQKLANVTRRLLRMSTLDAVLYILDDFAYMIVEWWVLCCYLLSDTCDYPGNITHGHVLLVGHIGKYEYRQYVQPVGHNEHIEYVCDKHYRLVGPSGSTCVNGTWSPSELPTCQPKHHPQLYYLYPNDQYVYGQLRRASLSPRRFF